MSTYLILWRFSPEAYRTFEEAKQVIIDVSEKLKTECSGLIWKEMYTAFGRFDIISIVEADDPLLVEKATMIILAYAHATTETMYITPWDEFLHLLELDESD